VTVSHRQKPIAAAMLVHGERVTEVPCASSLRQYNSLNVNMFMYSQLLERAVERGSQVFDFGRSTIDSGPHRFKRQWGPDESVPVWQYYVRRGEMDGLRKESPKYQRAISLWRRLPVWLTRWIGPPLARCLP
ncbi:MAG: GNAT family N-acetyltransferase, partial [Planctomycetales bacterium]|nr:GNAT family N-acetyltransferase [Planctomycetales bacterium]